MCRVILLFLFVQLLVLTPVRVVSQETAGYGTIAGAVRNNFDGQPLAGITVTVRGTTLAAVTDANGQYSLTQVPAGEHVVSFSKSGYDRTAVAQVKVLPGQTSSVVARLNPQFYELDEYEVLAEDLDDRAEVVLLVQRKGSANFLEAISDERFSKLAAGDAGEMLTKVTGVATVEGKFAVVRGLSERYNITLVNSGTVPSSDPYRTSVPLDLFPSDVVEQIVVSKTFTPDLPGGFAGAASDVRLKSIPDRFVGKASIGLGYNTQSTFNDDYLTYPGGDLDAFGMDDGTRALPGELEGETSNTLRQLYNGSFFGPAATRQAAAEKMDRLTRSFGTPHMGPTTDAPPLDHDFGLFMGDKLDVGGGAWGYILSVNYERDYRFYDDGIRGRYRPATAGNSPPPAAYETWSDARSETKAQWSGLVNLGYRPTEQHEVAFNFLYSQVGEDTARQLVGQVDGSGVAQIGTTDLSHRNLLHYVERNLTSYQLKGGHEITALNELRVDWLAGLANTSHEEPDLRYFTMASSVDAANPSGPERLVAWGQNYNPPPVYPTRYFRELDDQSLNAKLDLTLPLEDPRELEWKLKAGAYGNWWTRDFSERVFFYKTDDFSQPAVHDPAAFPYLFMVPPNAPPPYIVNGFYTFPRYLDSDFANTAYDGEQDIEAMYGIIEIPILESLRLSGGVRHETTRFNVNATVNDATQPPGIIDQQDLLPAVNLTWSLRQDMNLRLSYGETVARPTFREFAPYESYDPFTDDVIVGNRFLTMSAIQSFDVRWEWFTPRGGLLSLSGFHKTVQDPIEKYAAEVDADGGYIPSGSKVTFFNGEEATVQGVEFEARQNLGVIHSSLASFSLGGNFAWIDSEVPNQPQIQQVKFANTGRRVTTRPLYDQSPYIVNADISYDNARSGTSVTLAYYYAAERLALITDDYDVYEQGAAQLDLVISQRLGKHWKLKFSAKNLLNPEIIRSYAYESPTDTTYIYSSYTKGTTFGLSLSAEF